MIKMDRNNDEQKHTEKEIAIIQFQTDFTGKYPFLKLEVLKNDLFESQLKITYQNNSRPTLNKNVFNYSTKINLGTERTVAEVGADFNNLFDLPIQILRKSGNVWVETSLTEDWTLEHQNRQGEQISALF